MADQWRKMSESEKQKYREMSIHAKSEYERVKENSGEMTVRVNI